MHVDRLYLGRLIGDTGMVSDSAWNVFLKDVVTPRFPNGLTVYRADGQWRDAKGSIIREPALVLELMHVPDAATEARVAEVAEAYKKTFAQDAVMRVILPARVSF